MPLDQKKSDFLKEKNENCFKTICQDNLKKKKSNQKFSTSKDFTGNKIYADAQTENSNFTNIKDFKLNTIGDFYSNSELAGNFNSNFNIKNYEFPKENSFGDVYENEENFNFSEKINISTCGDQEMKINNYPDDFDDKQKSWNNYINFNSDQNMRNQGDHFYNQNNFEMKHLRNKKTPPKRNNSDYDEDYLMLEENIKIENTNNNNNNINEIKNIKIQTKNQPRKIGLNDSNEENNNIYPTQNQNTKIRTKNNSNDENNIPKNNINNNVTKKVNNFTKNVPLANKKNLPNQNQTQREIRNKNNIEPYFPKENKNNNYNNTQQTHSQENFGDYIQNDSLENKENVPNQNENEYEDHLMMEETQTQTNIQTQKNNVNVNNQENIYIQNDNQENLQPNINTSFNNNNNNYNNNNHVQQQPANAVTNLNQNSNTNNNTHQNNNNINFNTPNPKFMPILQKHGDQIPLEYIPDIWKSLKAEELSEASSPKFDSLNNQTDINFDMRAILIDWIVEVHNGYRLLPETLFICISIIDRYLSIKNINRTKLQLLGTTALFIACKYEEIVYPPLDEYVNITDKAYEKEEILEMEREILKELKYDITYPSPYRFFEIIGLNYNFCEVEFFYGSYLIEFFLISSNYTKYYPSIIGLAVVLLILRLKKYESYRDLYNLTDPENQKLIKECAREIYEFPNKCRIYNLNSVMNKYSSQVYHSVAVYQLENPIMDPNNNGNHNFNSNDNKN